MQTQKFNITYIKTAYQDKRKEHSPDGVAGGILLKHSERNRYSVAALFGLFRHSVILSGHRTLLSFCFREL
jgi:hypothetical protein